MESARLNAGDDPPRWLVRHIHHWSSSILLERILLDHFSGADRRLEAALLPAAA
jgi:hypothetical protein